jgi:hypothetical protein
MKKEKKLLNKDMFSFPFRIFHPSGIDLLSDESYLKAEIEAKSEKFTAHEEIEEDEIEMEFAK